MNRTLRTTLLAGLVGLLGLCAGVGVLIVMYLQPPRGRVGYLQYDNCALTDYGEPNDQYVKLATGELAPPVYIAPRTGEIVDIYVKLGEHDAFRLKELSFDEAMAKLSHVQDKGSAGSKDLFFHNRSIIGFRNNVLVGADLQEFAGIGVRPEGPFYELPLTRAQVVELFGEPVSEGVINLR